MICASYTRGVVNVGTAIPIKEQNKAISSFNVSIRLV